MTKLRDFMEEKNQSRRQAWNVGADSLKKWDKKHKTPMFGDDISREWIYMLEDKLHYVKGVAGEKVIKHSDFKDVIEDWEKLKKAYTPDYDTKKEMMFGIYIEATRFSMQHNQTVGEKRDYYITLEQLELFLDLNL